MENVKNWKEQIVRKINAQEDEEKKMIGKSIHRKSTVTKYNFTL